MAQEQTALVGESISVLVNVIDAASHVAATINTTTTRIEGFPATAPTVITVNVGIYRIVFSGVSPAPSEGDRLIVKINGQITSTGTAWTEYGIPVKILANDVSTFDQAVDAVITDAASRTASQANVSGLSTFDPAADTVANVSSVANVTNAVTTDAASRTASQADVSALATSASIAALNDFDAATDTVANVTLVGTTTTNTDMRGTDGANTVTPNTVAPDNAAITAIKTKTDQLAFSVANQVDANSLTGGTSPADIWSYATRTITSGGITPSEVADAVWDASYASHVLAGTFGKLMDQLRKANRAIDGEVSGTPTVSAFDSNLTGYATGAFDSEVLVFLSGPLEGEARPILAYDATNGRLTFEEVWTGVPNSSDEFVILPQHVHPISEIQNGLATSSEVATVIKTGVQYTATAQSGDTIQVELS